MISLKFPKRAIHLDCFTSQSYVFDHTKIQQANRFIPEWWKNIPKFVVGENERKHATMKSCAGFIDLYSVGVVLPLWSDFHLKLQDGAFFWSFSDYESNAIPHNAQQLGTFTDLTDTFHLKLESPWAFKCKENIKWHYTQPLWNQLAGKDYAIPSGVVEYKHQHTTSVNLLVRNASNPTNSKTIDISVGTPMAHIVPLSERPVVIHNHLISKQEYDNLHATTKPNAFFGSYLRNRKAREAEEARKCPFGFGGK